MHKVLVACPAHHEVVWLNVTMEKMHLVEKLHSPDNLVRKHENSFVGEVPSMLFAIILE
jgi:hypothetical protein